MEVYEQVRKAPASNRGFFLPLTFFMKVFSRQLQALSGVGASDCT